MQKLVLGEIRTPSVGELPVEMVERKGLGHPDTICDSIAENLSKTLSRYYLKNFGAILHHNVDKVLLSGGAARPRFKGGEVLEPIEVFLVGRATRHFKGAPLPLALDELALETTRQWFADHLKTLDPRKHVKIHYLIRPVSVDLADLFTRSEKSKVQLSNDTSIGVGFSPMTPLEGIVLSVERELNSKFMKDRHPEYGSDIKVLGTRLGGKVGLTVSCAFVDRFVSDTADYFGKKERLAGLVREIAGSQVPGGAEVTINMADKDNPESLYLTVTGTSAEAGDDGQVGRGNRANGLITPYRPMTLEAASGKNPVTHTGKLYQATAQRIADQLTAIEYIREAECYLVSQIGRPISEPQLVDVKLRMSEGMENPNVRKAVEAIVAGELGRLPDLWKEFLADKVLTF